MILTWLPAVLRDAGITVVETAGWQSRSHGELVGGFAVVWHHDASPPGDSPGALGWMISNWPNASANVWIDRYGVWHLVGVGMAWHAGSTGAGFPNNWNSLGIETDHTTGEDWPPALLDSLRKGTAAILRARDRDESDLFFHKQIAVPVGRKQDPDGLDIESERAEVAKLLNPVVPDPTPFPEPTPPEDDMPLSDTDIDRIATRTAEIVFGTAINRASFRSHIVAQTTRSAKLIEYAAGKGGARQVLGQIRDHVAKLVSK